jgi:hypothetical protein
MKPMLTCATRDALTLMDASENTVRTYQHRGLGACAFGADRPTTYGRYFVADAVTMLVRDALAADGMKLAEAAWHVRAFWDQLGMGASLAEHHHRHVLFAAGERLDDGLRWCKSGTPEQVATFVATEPQRRFFSVDLAKIIREVRERADAAGIILSAGCIFPPPESEAFVTSLMAFKRRRDSTLEKCDPFDAPTRRAFEAQAIGMQQ